MGCPSRARAGRAAGSGLDLGAVEQPGEHHRMRGPAQLSLARAMWVSVSLRPGTSGRQYSTTRYRPACSNATRSERAAIWLSTGSMRGSSTPEWGDQQRQPDRREAVEDRAVLGSDVPAGDHQHVVAQTEPIQHSEGVRLDRRNGSVARLNTWIGVTSGWKSRWRTRSWTAASSGMSPRGSSWRSCRTGGAHSSRSPADSRSRGSVYRSRSRNMLLSCADADFTCSRRRIKLSASFRLSVVDQSSAKIERVFDTSRAPGAASGRNARLGCPDAISGEPRWSCGHAAWLAAVAVARHGRGREPRSTHLAVALPVAGHHRGRAMTEPLEQAPVWVRVLATPSPRAGRDARRRLAEIAKWRRGEPSRVMTFPRDRP